MYVYKHSETTPEGNRTYTVGYYLNVAVVGDPVEAFVPESDHDSWAKAAARVNYLNGGRGEADADELEALRDEFHNIALVIGDSIRGLVPTDPASDEAQEAVSWLKRVDAAILATDIVPVLTAEHPTGMDRVESIEHLVKEVHKERETIAYLEEGIADDARRVGIDPTGCVGLAVCHLMVEKIEEMRGKARLLLGRLEREPGFPVVDAPGWLPMLEEIAGPPMLEEIAEPPGEEVEEEPDGGA
jgi:hypothetical protein